MHEANGSSHKEIKEERRFFCSELIAKAFKVLDVLRDPNSKGSNNYYPCSFDQGASIDEDMRDDVALGPPLNILVHGLDDLSQNSNLQMQRHSDYVDPLNQPLMRKDIPDYILKEATLNCFL